MARQSTRWLKFSIAVLVFSSYMGLSTTFRYSQMSALVPFIILCAMPIGEWMDRTVPYYHRSDSCTVVLVQIVP